MSPALTCLLALSLLGGPAAAGQAPEPFRDGQEVVFFGDSITHAGSYHAWVRLFYATRFPERRLRFHNAGLSGATIAGSLDRLEREVLVHRPDVVVLMFGMNDVNRSLYRTAEADPPTRLARERALATYRSALDTLLQRLAAAGAAAVVATPTPYDQYHAALQTENFAACNDGLARLAGLAREAASAHGCPLIDLHGPLTSLLRDTPDFLPAQDRVHPDTVGHLLAAYWLLRAQGVPALVAHASLDAAAGRAGVCEGCTVTDLARDGAALTFTYRAQALPFPTWPAYVAASALVPWNDLNRELLQVSGLPAGVYRLRLGPGEVGRFTAAELAAGVDLARLDTPQQRQAQLLRAAVLRKLAADLPLRSLALIENLLRGNHLDPADRASTEPFLDAFPERSAAKTYYQQEIAAYRKVRDHAAEARLALDESQAAIQALQVTSAWPVELRPLP